MDKKLTIKDIAKLAGVGKSTVSRYFNDGSIKEETREKIKKVIEENNFEPNQFAASLKAKQSKLIGVIAPCFDSTIASRILMSIDDKLLKEGYRSVVINTNHSQTRELDSIMALWRMNVDGIILIATNITMAHRTAAAKIDVPLIFLGQDVPGAISIINDDYHAGYDAGNLAGRTNPKNVLIVSVDKWDEAVGDTRRRGIVAGLKDNGITKIDIVESDFSYKKTQRLLNDRLDRKNYDAIICATDNMALAAFKVLKDRNFRVPEDVSLIGFGGYDITSLISPSLTSFRFESEYAGKLAVDTMIDLINGDEVEQQQVIGYSCIIGESVRL
ncbi:MAG: LacI family DNA-binding transcriptional regulator [Erysipelotrichaceae bacterium]|nr:LacI family DNA-binding transcriptional regulator [Erysipelotrichaceae bacterium]